MMGSAKMDLKTITIDVLDAASARGVGAKLIKAQKGKKYLVFIQEIDDDISVTAGYGSIYFNGRGKIP